MEMKTGLEEVVTNPLVLQQQGCKDGLRRNLGSSVRVGTPPRSVRTQAECASPGADSRQMTGLLPTGPSDQVSDGRRNH